MRIFSVMIGHNSMGRVLAACLLPVALLVGDLVSSPALFDTRVTEKAAHLGKILSERSETLGVFRGRQIIVSIDDVQEPDYLGHLTAGKTALLITLFPKDLESREYQFGPLTTAVLSKLKVASPNDFLRLYEAPVKLNGSAPGQVSEMPLTIPIANRSNFPVDRLLILTMPTSRLVDGLKPGFKQAIAIADKAGIETVVVPGLGLKWQNSAGADDLTPTEFFKTLFEDVPKSYAGAAIDLSLYKSWPTAQLEQTTLALDTQWRQVTECEDSPFRLYHQNTRLIEAFLIVTLISCSLATRLTVIKMILITITYFPAAFAAIELLEKITSEYAESARLAIAISTVTLLSILFPVLARLDIKNTFKRP